MFREVFSLLGYLVGYVLAMDYHEELASVLQSMVSQEIMARISEFGIIFTIVKILVALLIFFTVKVVFDLLGRLIRKSVEGSPAISFPDRIMGGLLGGLKGFVIVAIIMFPLSLFQGGYEKVTHGSVITPYLEKIIFLISKESYGNKFLDLSSEISVDGIQEKIKKMGDLDEISKHIKDKKDELLDTIQSGVQNGSEKDAMEKYTKEDKNKLNDLIETFSTK